MTFIREPFCKNNISPMQFRVTARLNSHLSGEDFYVQKWDIHLQNREDKINKLDKWNDDCWSDSCLDD